MVHLFRPALLLLIALLSAACTPALRSRYLTADDIERVAAPGAVEERSPVGMRMRPDCNRTENYIPDTNHLEHIPIRNIRLNIHFVNSADSSQNFVGDAGRRFVQELLGSANNDLANNQPMWLPPRNRTPALPTRYRYVLTPDPARPGDNGIYFHFDDEICHYVHKGANRNLSDRTVIDRYGVRLDSVLNIFIMPHHPDSIASPTYSAGGVGIALGNAVKLAGLYENGGPGWNYRGVFNHEVGHILGLSHSWGGNDGCDDTPRHPGNCWNRSSTPPCDTMASNNVMDYNAMQQAWTPCQLGRIHAALSRPDSRARAFLEPRWRRHDPGRTIVIADSVEWRSMKDLESSIVIENGGVLSVQCRVSLPAGARITVRPGGKLLLHPNARLHNDFGDRWEGIEIAEQGQLRGQVVFLGEPLVENTVHALE